SNPFIINNSFSIILIVVNDQLRLLLHQSFLFLLFVLPALFLFHQQEIVCLLFLACYLSDLVNPLKKLKVHQHFYRIIFPVWFLFLLLALFPCFRPPFYFTTLKYIYIYSITYKKDNQKFDYPYFNYY